MKHMICVQRYRPPIPLDTPELVRKVITLGWEADPDRRLSAAEMLAMLSSSEMERVLAMYQRVNIINPAYTQQYKQ